MNNELQDELMQTKYMSCDELGFVQVKVKSHPSKWAAAGKALQDCARKAPRLRKQGLKAVGVLGKVLVNSDKTTCNEETAAAKAPLNETPYEAQRRLRMARNKRVLEEMISGKRSSARVSQP